MASNFFQIAELLQSRSITATELCKLCLNRIHNVKDLNAYITVTENLAEKQATEADKRISNGI